MRKRKLWFIVKKYVRYHIVPYIKAYKLQKDNTVRLPLLFIFVIKYIVQNCLPIVDNTMSKIIYNFNRHEFEVELVCLTRRTISTKQMSRVTQMGVQTGRGRFSNMFCLQQESYMEKKIQQTILQREARHYVRANEPTENAASAQPSILRWQSAYNAAQLSRSCQRRLHAEEHTFSLTR